MAGNKVTISGYIKYHCKYWMRDECPYWVWVNGAPCAYCLADGKDVREIKESG
ncbi:hypothetical protein BJ878DRAFT_523304 [Calycina marina]|uniref:Uncharacterized protein n=1 Tax=Calycina marina TaxID=1763456 RepID=A0A9P7YVV6_9HELO|nr:hypothetical protein BJ878DRAFT_523304 [Calycina marina]